MKHLTATQSHRFVLVFRNETREISDAEPVWRGWIERVPDPRQREIARQSEERLGFQSLDEIPVLIERLIAAVGGPAAERKKST